MGADMIMHFSGTEDRSAGSAASGRQDSSLALFPCRAPAWLAARPVKPEPAYSTPIVAAALSGRLIDPHPLFDAAYYASLAGPITAGQAAPAPAKPLRRRQAWWFGERDSAVA